ncbi:MAG: response regulator [Pseudomonadota bacterium]
MAEQSKKILHVDDEIDIIYIVEFVLSNGGFEVVRLDDSTLAIEELKKTDYSLLILDLMMPKLDGFALLEKLRREASLQKLPVMILSSRQLTKDETDFCKNMKAFVMSKPFEPHRLLEKVREILTE